MEISRDSRRATVSAVNGLPRRRQRITTLRTDQGKQVELQETLRLGNEREFPKRRRIDRSVVQQKSDGGQSFREKSTGSSNEESYEEEEEVRIHHNNQLSPASRRGLRALRSSPVLRATAGEVFGVPIPRRARSSSAKRLHEYCSSGSGGFGEDLSHRKFPPSPASLIVSGDSMKKMRSLERRPNPISSPRERSATQDDIEIEVAEALFDLMKQSQPQTSHRREKVDGHHVITANHALKLSKADVGKGENNTFSVQNEPPIKVNVEGILADSRKERRKEGRVEKEKFSDEQAQDLVSGDGFVNKVKVGPPRESESPSWVVNASETQDPTVTKKAHYDAIIVEAKKETKLEIDLMASPLPSSPEREGLVDMATDPVVMTQAARNKSIVISNVDVEKHSHDTTKQQQVRKNNTKPSPTSLLPFHFGTSSRAGFLPHPGYTHPLLSMSGSVKHSMIMQPPQFKFSKSRRKRCATHHYLAKSIYCHEQLIKKSLSSGDFQGGQNKATASFGNKKDKTSDAAIAFNAMASGSKNSLLASSFLPAGHGFILPFGHHQAMETAAANSSASMLSNSAGRLPIFPSNESATYMAMLQSSIAMPTFFNPSLYPSPPFNVTQNELTTLHASVQSASQNTNLSSKGYASNASATPSSMAHKSGNQMMHHHKSSEGKSLAGGGQSFNYSKSDSSEISALSTIGLARNINPFQSLHMHLKSSTPHSIHESFFPRTAAGQSHINFGNSVTSYKGHQFGIKSEPMKNSCLPSQEAEASQAQNSSSACRRSVPSVLSIAPGHLPELKH